MNDSTQQMLLFGAVLFTIGMVGFLTRRSMILMFLSLEMMLAGVSMNLIAFSKQHHNYQGQVMAIMVLTVAACEAAIALAMVVSLFRRKATLDINVWSELNETPHAPVSESTPRSCRGFDRVPQTDTSRTRSGLDADTFRFGAGRMDEKRRKTTSRSGGLSECLKP